MKATAFIFARGGSKGLPNKNICLLAGRPLIAWSIEHARSVRRIERVIVSTDSNEIAEIALEFGAEVPFMRPIELAQDHSPEWQSWRHALSYLKESEGGLPEVMVSVPATSPLRSSEDIESCLDYYSKGESDIVITVAEAHRNPYFNMVKVDEDGVVSLVNPPATPITRRQDAPRVYDMTTVCYVARPEFILTHDSIFQGRVGSVVVPLERSIDIDTAYDFKIAEALLNLEG